MHDYQVTNIQFSFELYQWHTLPLFSRSDGYYRRRYELRSGADSRSHQPTLRGLWFELHLFVHFASITEIGCFRSGIEFVLNIFVEMFPVCHSPQETVKTSSVNKTLTLSPNWCFVDCECLWTVLYFQRPDFKSEQKQPSREKIQSDERSLSKQWNPVKSAETVLLSISVKT